MAETKGDRQGDQDLGQGILGPKCFSFALLGPQATWQPGSALIFTDIPYSGLMSMARPKPMGLCMGRHLFSRVVTPLSPQVLVLFNIDPITSSRNCTVLPCGSSEACSRRYQLQSTSRCWRNGRRRRRRRFWTRLPQDDGDIRSPFNKSPRCSDPSHLMDFDDTLHHLPRPSTLLQVSASPVLMVG